MESRLVGFFLRWLIVGAFVQAGCSTLTTSNSERSAGSSGNSSNPGSISQSGAAGGSAGGYPLSSLEAMRRGLPGQTGFGPLQDVYYDFDHYELRPEAREILKSHGQWLKANPSVKVEIEGHADERGTNEYNLALAAKRADVARDYLAALGVSGERLSAVSYGEEIPVCTENSEECWQLNRRSHFIVVGQKPPVVTQRSQ